MKQAGPLRRALLPAIFLLALPAASFALTAPPLGIECASVQGWDDRSKAADDQVDKAEAAGDWKAAIQGMRVMAGYQCDNAYLWMRLAIFYARAGQAKEAFEVGAYDFANFPNQVEGSLNYPQDQESFREVRALAGFAESALGKALAAKYAERDARNKKAREAVAALPAAQRPPENFVAKNACPFECCVFQEWSVEQEIELFAAPEGAKLGRKLKPGDHAEGLTGEVHLKPRPLVVGFPMEGESELGSDQRIHIPVGAVVWELDSLGEGFVRFWYQGQKFEAPLGANCLVFDEECWSDYIEPGSADWKNDWWVKVKLKDGKEAWARDEGFGNMDACG